MYRLVYVSTAVDGLSDADIDHILNVSQSNNDERYITGFLAHNGRSFMQALEGDRNEVEEIYDRIVNDDRHFGVTRIIGEPVGKRAFPEWSMNYQKIFLGAFFQSFRRVLGSKMAARSNRPHPLEHPAPI